MFDPLNPEKDIFNSLWPTWVPTDFLDIDFQEKKKE